MGGSRFGSTFWAYQLARDTARRLGDSEAERYCTQMMRSPDALIWQLPVLGEHHPVLRKYFPAYFEWCEHSGYDAYWAERDWLPKVKERPVPSLQIGGWYDVFLMGTMQSYEALQQEPGSPELFHRLIVGPWTHIPWGRKAGGVDHGDQADGDIHLEQVRWFDYWLKDKRDAELFHEPAIRYFERGSNVWRHSDRTSLMQPAAESSLWYLQGGEKPANGALGGGSLSPEEPGGAPSVPDVFVYDARLPMSLESYLPWIAVRRRTGMKSSYIPASRWKARCIFWDRRKQQYISRHWGARPTWSPRFPSFCRTEPRAS